MFPHIKRNKCPYIKLLPSLLILIAIIGCGSKSSGDSQPSYGVVVIKTNRSEATYSLSSESAIVADSSTYPLGAENTVTIPNMTPGNYSVTFNAVSGCATTPAVATGVLEANQTLDP